MKHSEKHPSSLAFRGGSYSLAATALVLAILVALNVMAGAIPPALTRLDISSSKLYSVTSNTKTVLNHLADDVTIYWITQAGEEDEVLQNLLSKYETLSDHIQVVKKNPDVYPTFAEAYTSETVLNNSLVVECGDRSRYIGFDDIYLQQADMSSLSYDASFDGEGAITSAIDYVVNEEQPVVYLLEGHGEEPLPDAFLDQVEKANMEVASFSLLTADAVPEEAACVLLHAPSSDLSTAEIDLLDQYTREGGKLLVLAGPTESGSLPNLNSLLERYGVQPVDGVVVEEDRSHFAFRTPYVLLPDALNHPITDPLLEEHYYPVVPIAQGLLVAEAPADAVVTPLLMTSPTSFSKAAGYHLTTYEREEGDQDGPFALGVDIQTGQGGEIVWFSSSQLLADLYNAYSSGANVDLTMNALASLVGESEAMAIRSKSLNYHYLTISESTASVLKVLMIGVFPLAYLGVGVAVVLKRKEHSRERK